MNGQMVGVGAGQQSRVDCVKLAARKVCTWYLRQHPKVSFCPQPEHRHIYVYLCLHNFSCGIFYMIFRYMQVLALPFKATVKKQDRVNARLV